MAITKTPPSNELAPTTQAYHEVQLAFDFFNAALFDGKLPACLITFQRRGSSTLGYYAAKRYVTAAGGATDEIALNPRFFQSASFEDVMSVLVHEMAHAWQAHFGRKRSRNGYHNKEWAGEMLRLGLRPISTTGKMTGQSVAHTIIPGERFAVALEKLRTMLPALTWRDAREAHLMPKGLPQSELLGPVPLSGRRTIYRCPACKDRAEGKSTLFIICGKCNLRMEREGLR
jgi:predicted SprT family Zn-dependent metalloprotease